MQIKKDEVKEKILNSARGEFLEHGYAEASLRVIADKEGLTKGAVYSYFENKDALFYELTAPAINIMENSSNRDDRFYSNFYEIPNQLFESCAHAVLDNYESFKLLLFCSAGSSLQDYREIIIQLYTKNFYKLLAFFTQTEPCKECVICEMFIHTLANTFVSFLEEIILHEPDRKEAEEYAEQMAIFVHSGIVELYSRQICRETENNCCEIHAVS